MDPHFDGVIFQTHALELARRLERPFPPFVILDLRDAADYHRGHLPGAVNATPEALEESLPTGTERTTEFIVAGADPSDERVRRASLALRRHGARRIVEFQGGLDEWVSYGLPIEQEVAA